MWQYSQKGKTQTLCNVHICLSCTSNIIEGYCLAFLAVQQGLQTEVAGFYIPCLVLLAYK